MRSAWIAVLLLACYPVQALASTPVVVNGVTYNIPVTGERGWGQTVTAWIIAVSNALGGGGGGITNANVATNAAIARSKLASGTANRIVINNGTGVMSDNAALTAGRLLVADGSGLPSSLAAITANRLLISDGTGLPIASAALTANRALVTNGSGLPVSSAVTDTELAFLTGVTSALCGINQTCTLTNKTISGLVNTITNIDNSSTTATSANTINAIVARDGSGNFSAGTITAALTGTASGNTTYTPNNHGVVVSSATNAMTVVAPVASTTFVLTSGGTGADPTWQAAPLAAASIVNWSAQSPTVSGVDTNHPTGVQTITFATAGTYKVTLNTRHNHANVYSGLRFSWTIAGTATRLDTIGTCPGSSATADDQDGSESCVTLWSATAGQTATVVPVYLVTTGNPLTNHVYRFDHIVEKVGN